MSHEPITSRVIAGQQIRPFPPDPSNPTPGPDPVVLIPGAVGPHPQDRRSLRFSQRDLSTNILVSGAIGAGKTTLLLHLAAQVRRRLGPDDGLLIFDSKGDFLAHLHRPGDVVIAPRAGSPFLDRWNVFEELVDEGDAAEISALLFADRVAHSTQSFFPRAAAQIFEGVLLHLHRRNRPADRHNALLRETWDAADSPERIAANLSEHADLRALTAYLARPDTEMALGIYAEAQQVVRALFVDAFADPGTIGVRAFARQPRGRALFVVHDVARGETLSPGYQIMFDMALKEILSRSRPRGHLYIIADEAALLPRLRLLASGLNFGRSLGLSIIWAVQSVSQILAGYETHTAHSILAGFGTQVVFRLNDAATRDHVQRLLGRNLTMFTVPTWANDNSVVHHVLERPVLDDAFIATLPTGRALVLRPPDAPAWLQLDLFGER